MFLVRSVASRLAALAALAGLDLARVWQVIIGPHRRTRTHGARHARYWSVLGFAAQASGYTAPELHELCKQHILGCDTRTLGAVSVDIPRSTTRLTTTEFSGYAAQAEAWLVRELDLRLPAWGFDA